MNLLLADDVGLGKTIEAGLVVQELILRNRIRNVLVVCPSGLQLQWRDQMREKFGLEFRIVNAELLKELRRSRGLFTNPWTHFPRLITSIDFLKREPQMRRFREVLPGPGERTYPRRFDLLIVDEAHNVAPSGRTKAVPSERTRAIATIAPHYEHRLFLSATPHNGYPESFQALLELIDDQRFHRGVAPDKAQLGAVMVRRLKSDLPPHRDGSPRYPPRRIEALSVEFTDEEREAHQWLKRYSESRERKAKAAVESDASTIGTQFVLKLLKKRFFSSPEAFASTLEKHVASYETGYKKRRKATGALETRVLARYLDEVEERDEDEDAELDEALQDATLQLLPLDAEEAELLDKLRAYADRARAVGDSKLNRLVKYLVGITKDAEGNWTDERVIVFTEYRATQNWLLEQLAYAGFDDSGRVAMIYGSMRTDEREAVKAAFQASPDAAEVRILLATDAASEGIDLQNHCARLVHYEIPWNPNRLEQRNGRVDRHGQRGRPDENGKPVVFIHHFVGGRVEAAAAVRPGELEGDLEFLAVAARKVSQIREDLGRVGPVIARQVEEAMQGRRADLDTTQAEQESRLPREMLRVERKHREDLERLRRALDDSRKELNATPERVERLVTTALELAGQPRLLPVETGADVPAFKVPALAGTWQQALLGLEHPHTQEVRPISFAEVGDRDDLVWAHLNHRLVALSVGLLRAEGWSGSERLARFSVRQVAASEVKGPTFVAFGRLVVHGGDQQKLHEELIAAAYGQPGGRLGVNESERVGRLEGAPYKGALDVRSLWADAADAVHQALQARTGTRMQSLTKTIAEREQKDLGDIEKRLHELEAELKTMLSDNESPATQQEMLPGFGERPTDDPAARARRSIEQRLRDLPHELQSEQAAIRRRYENPQHRMFPVAVSVLIPKESRH